MKRMDIARSAAILALTAVFFASGCASTSVARGVTGGDRLGLCPIKPNCVSTQNKDGEHAIAPLRYSGDKAAAKEKLLSVLTARSNTKIIENNDDYLRVEFTTSIMRFVDDGEFLVRDGQIELRSASRVGYSDLGTNRARMAEIRAAFETCCK